MTPQDWFNFCATAGECWLATVNPDDLASDHTDVLWHYNELLNDYDERDEDPPNHTVREVVQPVIDALRSDRLEGAWGEETALVCGVSSENLALASFGDHSDEYDWMTCAADDAIEKYINAWYGNCWELMKEVNQEVEDCDYRR